MSGRSQFLKRWFVKTILESPMIRRNNCYCWGVRAWERNEWIERTQDRRKTFPAGVHHRRDCDGRCRRPRISSLDEGEFPSLYSFERNTRMVILSDSYPYNLVDMLVHCRLRTGRSGEKILSFFFSRKIKHSFDFFPVFSVSWKGGLLQNKRILFPIGFSIQCVTPTRTAGKIY